MHRRGRIITAVVAFGFLALALVFLLKLYRDAKRIQTESQELSRMMSVRIIVGSALSEYYMTNAAYPMSLEKLPAGLLKWDDEGSSAADLKLLHYNSTSNTFTLVWERGTNYHLFVGGRTGELYWNEEDFAAPLRLKR